MAFEENLRSITAVSNADFTGKQYRFVKVTAARTVSLASVSGERVYGVAQNAPAASGRAVTVGYAGVSQVEAGGNVSAGDKVTTDASGKAITAQSGNHIAGTAISAGSSTQLVSVHLDYLGTA